MPHFRLPSIAPGVQAFVWAFAEGVGVDGAVAGVVAAVAGAAVFLLVRLYGEDEPRRTGPPA